MATRDIIFAAAGAAGEATYVEDVFSTWLYTGNGSTQTITNGIDLAGEGGLVWIKGRNEASDGAIFDTERGISRYMYPTGTAASSLVSGYGVTAFNNNGFAVTGSSGYYVNTNTTTYASWTFRKAPKFFDVVTYTGNDATQNIAHNLGSVPGMIIVKRTSGAASWQVYHRSLASGFRLRLNLADAATNSSGEFYFGNNTTPVAPTSTQFTVGLDSDVNGAGQTYVAYLFAHDAGGFGLSGNDNVISCGTFTTDSSWNATVNLGYEPQFLLYKSVNFADAWAMIDTMRNWSVVGGFSYLQANASSAELTYSGGRNPTATGFEVNTGMPNQTYIYMAIRRGPMKTPTSGTQVFSPVARTGTGTSATITSLGFAPDLLVDANRPANQSGGKWWFDKLRGRTVELNSVNTNPESGNYSDAITAFTNTGYILGADSNGIINANNSTYINWVFRRAPGFFDIVCYTGTGSNRTVTHNLGVAPELMIVKRRNTSESWFVYANPIGNTKYTLLNYDLGVYTDSTFWNNTTPTASVFSLGTNTAINNSADTYVAYLFATLAGVSKVGSYTGTGTTQIINCGFTTGARYVLIKRTDSTGDWYVWDSARGIVAGNDPYLLLNSSAAEVTNTDYIDAASSGFEISSTAPAAINANGGTYIYLAIA